MGELWIQPLPSFKYTLKIQSGWIYSEITKMFYTELFHYLQRDWKKKNADSLPRLKGHPEDLMEQGDQGSEE